MLIIVIYVVICVTITVIIAALSSCSLSKQGLSSQLSSSLSVDDSCTGTGVVRLEVDHKIHVVSGCTLQH